MDENRSETDKLEARLGERWDAIRKARQQTDELLRILRETLADLHDSNLSIVVTGSLGRGEVTHNSDADWVLLVDGPSIPDHAKMLPVISARVSDLGIRGPGRTGTFGSLVSSHDLVQYIAGTRDTNENLTRRILLLAESKALTNPMVRERVIQNVLARYVVYDRSVPRKDGRPYTIPQFLLNDVVRYWRTMASDYASKMWERQHDEWGIRNIKLRFSRKLLFVWGLLASFSAQLFEHPQLSEERLQKVENAEEYYVRLSEAIREQTEVTPLELLARVVNQQANDDTARAIFSSYNDFLALLSDETAREALQAVRFEDAATDPAYGSLRKASGSFRSGINRLFFDDHPVLRNLIRDYGVF